MTDKYGTDQYAYFIIHFFSLLEYFTFRSESII